jgi:hypothetical protein
VPDLLHEARYRLHRSRNRDGLEEIALGVMLLLQGGFTLVNDPAHRNSWWQEPAMLIYVLLFLGLGISAPHIRAVMRERITYSRAGYVRYAELGLKRGLVLALLLFFTTFVGLIALRYAGHVGGWDLAPLIRWSPAVMGLVAASLLFYASVSQGTPRFLVVGILSIALGVTVSIEYRPHFALGIYFVGVGCAMLCSGGVALWNYLQITPPSAHET